MAKQKPVYMACLPSHKKTKHKCNPFEVNVTIVGVKIWHDYKWGCDNLVQDCMELFQPSKSLYGCHQRVQVL
jgi:hypothetical protein